MIDSFIGSKFGKWEVISFSHKDRHNHPKYLCRCACGTEKVLFAGDLRRGNTQSCGCLKNILLSEQNVKDIVGQRFNYLVVESFSHTGKGGAFWNCLCDCGNKKVLRGSDIKSGDIKSCGCFRKELAVERNTTHGLYHHPLYITWKNMCSRCNDEGSPLFPYYGGRGIKVCNHWNGTGGFPNFLEDMGEGKEGHSLDRIDNEGDYCKENCRWATREEQQRNRRSNTLLTFNGETKTLVEWAEDKNILPKTLNNRINKLGWNEEKAIVTETMDKFSNSRKV